MNILIQEPDEFNPVELIRQAQYFCPQLTYHDFATAFKCEVVTISKWMCGMNKPSKAYRVWAAELKRKWDL